MLYRYNQWYLRTLAAFRRGDTATREVSLADSDEKTNQIADSELLQRHLDGDPTAFETLIKRYQHELFGFLARFTGNHALADDVFQETFLQLHISAASFDQNKRLKPWLFTISANKARDALRSRTRRQMASLDASIAGGDGDDADYASLMPADIPTPDEITENKEIRQVVQELVNELPENLRMVLTLCYFHDFPYKEIADVLEIPLGTVKSRLHAAVKQFQKLWQANAERLGYGQAE